MKDVERMILDIGLDPEFAYYAFAMKLSDKQFNRYEKISGCPYSKGALLMELGLHRRLADDIDRFPGGPYSG